MDNGNWPLKMRCVRLICVYFSDLWSAGEERGRGWLIALLDEMPKVGAVDNGANDSGENVSI